METTSRTSWQRCSGDLIQAHRQSVVMAAAAAQGGGFHDDHDESSALLRQKHGNNDRTSILYGTSAASGRDMTHVDDQPEKRLSLADSTKILYDEAQHMISLALPVIATYLLEMLPGIVSIMLVGHVPSENVKLYMDSAALAVMYVNLTALSIGFGLASAMDTLCSNAFGAGELNQKAPLYFTTGCLVLTTAFVFILVLNLNARTVLTALGQPEAVADLAGTFCLYLLPGIPALLLYELVRKILQASNVAMPMLYCAMGANVLNAGLGYYWIFVMPSSDKSSFMGPDNWLGAAVARTVCNISLPVFLAAYLSISGEWKLFWSTDNNSSGGNSTTSRTIHWFQQAIRGIPTFISLGVPGALQLCFEWWAFEVLALLSGLLPNAIVAIGTNAILLNIASLVYMLYLGLSIAANVRIGNALGANQCQRAPLAGFLAFGLATLLSLFCASILIIFRKSLPYLFTHDPDIADYCSELLWIAAAFQLPDALNAAVQGIFRGSGRQNIGAGLNFIAYYVVGLPVGAVLAYRTPLALNGLWIGVSVGLFLVATTGIVVIVNSDWKKLAKDAIQRLLQ